jgi:probable HAF family extracellular repeat protein
MSVRHRPRSWAYLLFAVLAAPLMAYAAPTYSVTPIGTDGSYPTGINNSGQVVGYFAPSAGGQHAFLFTSAGFLDLGTLGGLASRAAGINDAGVVVGAAGTAFGATHAFSYTSGGMVDLGTLGGQNSSAEAISNSGRIVGSAQTAAGFSNAYITTAGGAIQSLGTLPLGESSRAYGVNNAGQVVGDSRVGPVTFPEFQNHAFRYSGGTMTDLGTLGNSYSQATGINDLGQVVGWSGVDGFVDHAFMVTGAGMIDLGTLGGQGSSGAYGINSAGQVVGWSDLQVGNDLFDTAFLYQGGAMIDLNTLIDPASGWTLGYATAINDHQQIAAFGCNGTLCQALRLDLVPAVPEPHTGAMLLAGGGMLGWTMRGRRRLRRPAGWD